MLVAWVLGIVVLCVSVAGSYRTPLAYVFAGHPGTFYRYLAGRAIVPSTSAWWCWSQVVSVMLLVVWVLVVVVVV